MLINFINGQEIVNLQIRPGTPVVGIFPIASSGARLITAVLAEIHNGWLTGRLCLNLAKRNEMEKALPDRIHRITVAEPLSPSNLLNIFDTTPINLFGSKKRDWINPNRLSRGQIACGCDHDGDEYSRVSKNPHI